MPDQDPLQQYVAKLRRVREMAGKSYRKLAKDAHYSLARMHAVQAGNAVPGWDSVRAYLLACDVEEANLPHWQRELERVAASKPGRRTKLGNGESLHLAASKVVEPYELLISTHELRAHRNLSHMPAAPQLPDPTRISTSGEFIDALGGVRRAWGDPSLRLVSQRTGLSRSTIYDMLSRDSRVPRWANVNSFLVGFGVMHSDLIPWRDAWVRATPAPVSRNTVVKPRRSPNRGPWE